MDDLQFGYILLICEREERWKQKNFKLLLWKKKIYQESVEKGYGFSKMVLGSSSSSWWTWARSTLHHHHHKFTTTGRLHAMFFCFGWGKSRCEDLIFVQMFPGIWLLLRLLQSFIGSLSLCHYNHSICCQCFWFVS